MRYSSPAIAFLEKELEIPASPGSRTDEPFDVGKIEMEARKIIKVGNPAPAFEVKTIDDKPLKLSHFAGKFVLLDFWAVWCGPCVAETPHLNDTWDAFKDDSGFRMIVLSLDPISKTPRDYCEEEPTRLDHGFPRRMVKNGSAG